MGARVKLMIMMITITFGSNNDYDKNYNSEGCVGKMYDNKRCMIVMGTVMRC